MCGRAAGGRRPGSPVAMQAVVEKATDVALGP